ncbi:MAG: hypothetical protein Fur0034_16380 [Desulfuromonadia bacterium]
MTGKVLFVDDEQNVLRAVERIFIDDDIDLLFARSASEALETMDAHPDIRVIVSDYRMPGMNGVELLREVYRRTPRTVRMVLSGFADTGAVVDAINLGHVARFIPKPWNEEELRSAVLQALVEGGDGLTLGSGGPTAGEILEHIPLPLVVLDRDARIVSCTPRFRELCSCPFETCRGVPIDTLLPLPEDRDEVPRRIETPMGSWTLFRGSFTSGGEEYQIVLLGPAAGEVG